MGVQQNRRSKSRNRHRRANHKLTAPKLVRCAQCHSFTVSHRVCPECGYYKGKMVIAK